jgi:hypothetical protein
MRNLEHLQMMVFKKVPTSLIHGKGFPCLLLKLNVVSAIRVLLRLKIIDVQVKKT